MRGMSIADGMPQSILLPADPDFRANRERAARSNHLRRGAILAAALTHVLVIAAMIVDWPMLFPITPLERPPIPVSLVMLPPPPPPPQAKPAPPPPPPALPQQQQQYERVSGPDTKTTAPAQAADQGEEAAPKPTPMPPADTQAKAAAPEEKPTPPQDKAKQEKPKVAKRETTPKPAQGLFNRLPGERVTNGDPYLNRLQILVEQHRTYPSNAMGTLGLPLEGIGTYLIAVDASGRLLSIEIQRSAGAAILDQAAIKMITSAAPFPPLPSDYPGPIVEITVRLPIYPVPSSPG